MALADIPSTGQPRRLDSWKEVAEYLGRDVRTATRWEAQGMPLHRVPGRKGSSVFALTNEIDDWLAGKSPDAIAPPTASRRVWPQVVLASAGVVALSTAALVWLGGATERDPVPLRVSATPSGVSIVDSSGAGRVIHTFGPALGVLVQRAPARVLDLNADGEPEILVAVSFYDDRATRAIRHGELLSLSTAGGVRWRFAFDDVITFGDRTQRGPWALSDWQEGPSSTRKTAVAAHDFTWWGSLVAILDHEGRRLSTFVNPGWIESVLWLDPDRLAAAGFSNPRNEAVLAILNANDANGQAPGSATTAFACSDCSSQPPLFYAALPRSELNRATGARFNRSSVSAQGEMLLVTTVELEHETATAIYEFDGRFSLVRARYSEGYWDAHRRLEFEGRLTHTREACPERDGPAAIHVWNASAGWVRIESPAKR